MNIIRTIVTVVLIISISHVTSRVVRGSVMYFYSPELNVGSYVPLKIAFDSYLSDFGDYQFQPFKDKDILEKYVNTKSDGIILVSSWYYTMIRGKTKLKPIMVGVSKGKTVQKRVLVASKQAGSVDNLRGSQISASGTQEYNREFLKHILGDKKDILDSIRILIVPKDIDALMSISFGLTDFAITTDTSLEKLSAINKRMYNSLVVLKYSENIMLPLILVPADFDDKEFIRLIEGMENDPKGLQVLKMLGLDKFRRLNHFEIKAIE